MPLFVRASGATKQVAAMFVRAGSATKQVRAAWIRAGGATKQIFSTLAATWTPDPASDLIIADSAPPPYNLNVVVTINATNAIGSASVVSVTRQGSGVIGSTIASALTVQFFYTTSSTSFFAAETFDVVVQDSGGNQITLEIPVTLEVTL